MKIPAIILIGLSVIGCATKSPQPMTTEQINAMRYTKRDCAQIDQHINDLEAQLKSRGLLNKAPESLNETDRVYNATARISVWNLRIGCNNPNRFANK